MYEESAANCNHWDVVDKAVADLILFFGLGMISQQLKS